MYKDMVVIQKKNVSKIYNFNDNIHILINYYFVKVFHIGKDDLKVKLLNLILLSFYNCYSLLAKLKALNDFLEDKKYLLGDRPCNEDASLFGIFAQFIYAYNGTLNKYILSIHI